jgi:hypothetical protein
MWSMPIRFLSGTGGPQFLEQDWVETGDLGGCVGNCVHQGGLTWQMTGGPSSGGPLYQSSPNPISTENHTWGALCVAPADNGGTSKYQIFLDNVAQHAADTGLSILNGDKWIVYFSGGQTITSCDFWGLP